MPQKHNNTHLAVSHKTHPTTGQVTTDSFAAPSEEEALSWLFGNLGGIENLHCSEEGLGCGSRATRVTHPNGDHGYVLPTMDDNVHAKRHEARETASSMMS